MPRLLHATGQRLVQFAVTLFGVVAVMFCIQALVPADPAALLAGPGASAEQLAALRAQYGLDQPVIVQFAHYLMRLATGDLGISLFSSQPVISDLIERLPATMELALTALVISLVLGVPLGVVAALKRNTAIDHVLRLVTVSGFAVASFWLAIMLQLLLVMDLGWLPLSGRIEGAAPPHATGFYLIDSALALNGAQFASALAHLALPAATLAFPVMATIVRFTRAGVLDSLSRPSVQYLEAMGLPRGVIVWKYVLRGALTSVTTQIGLLSGALLGGSVVTEAIFDWPGLGYYIVNSVVMFDYNAILGASLWIAAVYVIANFLVDLLQGVIDPRASAR
jgi:peptide/nickel transport system permease protein